MSLSADAPAFVPSHPNSERVSQLNLKDTTVTRRGRNKPRRRHKTNGDSNISNPRNDKGETNMPKESAQRNGGNRKPGQGVGKTRESKNKQTQRRSNRRRHGRMRRGAHCASIDSQIEIEQGEALSFTEFRSLFPPLDSKSGAFGHRDVAYAKKNKQRKWSNVAWNAYKKELKENERERLEAQQKMQRHGSVVLTTLQRCNSRHDSQNTSATASLMPTIETSSIHSPAPALVSHKNTKTTNWDMAKLRNRWWQIIREKKLQQREQLLQEINVVSDSSHDSTSLASDTSGGSEDIVSQHGAVNIKFESAVPVDNEYLQQPYPLHQAILKNDPVAVSQLLDANKDGSDIAPRILQRTDARELGLPEVHSSCGRKTLSPLELAIYLDRPHLVKLLWWSSASESNERSVDSTRERKDNVTSTTPLMFACMLGRDGCIRLLLSHGGTKSHRNRLTVRDKVTGNTALHYVCSAGAPASTLSLIVGGGGRSKNSSRMQQQKLVTTRNYKGQTPLHVACQGGHEHLVQALLHGCASSLMSKVFRIQDDLGRTPLLAAIGAEHANVVMSLLMWRGNHYHHADQIIAQQSKSAKMPCPLTWAASRGSLYMVSLLLEFNDPTTASGGMHQYSLTGALHATIRSTHCKNRAEMVRVLIEAGANPFLPDDDKNQELNTGQDSAVSMVACQNESDADDVLQAILNTFARIHATTSTMRRQDPILRRQPKSYFEGIERKEIGLANAALSEALVRSLFFGWASPDNIARMRYLRSSIILLQHGARLTQGCYSRLKSSMVARRLLPSKEASSNDGIFLYSTSCLRFCNPVSGRRRSTFKYDASDLRYWSEALCAMAWMDNEEEMQCRWIQAESDKQETIRRGHTEAPAPDVILLAGKEKFLVHSDLLALKSEKLAAAFRFGCMKATDKISEKLLQVETGLSPKMCKYLLQHIYHGSIVSGWANNDDSRCCQELLEIAVMAEEFLCPSLVRECEMRLLASKPFACFCWSCCMPVTKTCDTESVLPKAKYMYRVKGPSRLINPEVVLDVVAVSQQLCTTFLSQSGGSISYMPLDKVSSSHKLPHDSNGWSKAAPFECVNEASMHVLLKEFPTVLNSEQYAAHVCDTDVDDASEDRCSAVGSETTLLHMCLDGLARSNILRTKNDRKSKPASSKEFNIQKWH